MSEQDKRLLEIRKKNENESQKMLNEAINESAKIGKEPFNLQELKKNWTFRYANKLNGEQVARAIKEIERDYYLAGKRFMTMEQYGKHLMEMELYR